MHWLFPKSFLMHWLLPFYFSVVKSKLFYYFIHVNFWQIREATLFALSSLSEQLFETEVGESYFSCEFWYVELEVFVSSLSNFCFHFEVGWTMIYFVIDTGNRGLYTRLEAPGWEDFCSRLSNRLISTLPLPLLSFHSDSMNAAVSLIHIFYLIFWLLCQVLLNVLFYMPAFLLQLLNFPLWWMILSELFRFHFSLPLSLLTCNWSLIFYR